MIIVGRYFFVCVESNLLKVIKKDNIEFNVIKPDKTPPNPSSEASLPRPDWQVDC